MSRDVIQATANFVRLQLNTDCTGHDWWHVQRVWRLASYIAEQESVDSEIVELSALLHDMVDQDNKEPGLARIQRWLGQQRLAPDSIKHICGIIGELNVQSPRRSRCMSTLEGRVVQDADRLDHMGAIGIARTFADGGFRGRLMHDPALEPLAAMYSQPDATTINQFYEKLLLLKDCMNTTTAKKLAQMRHQLMESFLRQFLVEWELFKDHK